MLPNPLVLAKKYESDRYCIDTDFTIQLTIRIAVYYGNYAREENYVTLPTY
jgi:hypothetical protein